MSGAVTINEKCDSTLISLIEKFFRFLEVEKRYSTHTLNSYRIDIFYFLNYLFKVKEKIISKNDLENLNTTDELVLWINKHRHLFNIYFRQDLDKILVSLKDKSHST